MQEKVGFIGLGNMGKPMAINLARAGLDLMVYDLRPETTVELSALGAKVAGSTAELGEKCDIISVVVINDRQVEEVISGRGQGDGLLAGMKPGGLIIIHSTITPATCQRLAAACAKHGIAVIDAAVSGAEARSIAGTLTLMVGGDDASVARAQPIFSIVGEDIFHTGGVGMGLAAKLCNNLMALTNLKVAEEAMALARAAGINEERMIEIGKVSSGDSWALGNIASLRALLLMPGTDGGTMAKIADKDLHLAKKFADSLGLKLGITNYVVNNETGKIE